MNKMLLIGALFIFAGIFIIRRGPLVLSISLSNVGSVILDNRSFNGKASSGLGSSADVRSARQVLETATRLQADNIAAWRKLGYVGLIENDAARAQSAWLHVPEIGVETKQWASKAMDRGDFETALAWYRRYSALYPQYGDGWYAEGVILLEKERWGEAIAAFEHAAERGTFQAYGPSDVYFQLGALFQRDSGYRDLARAERMYQTALRLGEFSNDRVEAETHYKQGELYGWMGRDEEALAEYEKALDLQPTHAWARLRRAYAQYQVTKELQPAEQEIMNVIADWQKANSRNLIWAYIYLGEIYEGSGMVGAAASAYEKAERLDSTNPYLRSKLSQLNER